MSNKLFKYLSGCFSWGAVDSAVKCIPVQTIAKDFSGRPADSPHKLFRVFCSQVELNNINELYSLKDAPQVNFAIGQVVLVELSSFGLKDVANIHISKAVESKNHTTVTIKNYKSNPESDLLSMSFHLAFIESKKEIIFVEEGEVIVVI